MKNITYAILLGAVAAALPSAYGISENDTVKVSASNICHPKESPYYDRVNAVRVTTLAECENSGGRLPTVLLSLRAAEKELMEAIRDGEPEEVIQEKSAQVATEHKEVGNEELGFKDFGGLRFGLGIGMSFLGDQIDEVRVIDGRVAVTKERSNQGRVILESHKFMFGLADPDSGRILDRWAFGPFVAASLADEQGQGPLSAYGLGLMAGYRIGRSARSFNIGIGWFVDTDTLALRPGIEEGMTTTLMESDLTQRIDREGLAILVSGSW